MNQAYSIQKQGAAANVFQEGEDDCPAGRQYGKMVNAATGFSGTAAVNCLLGAGAALTAGYLFSSREK